MQPEAVIFDIAKCDSGLMQAIAHRLHRQRRHVLPANETLLFRRRHNATVRNERRRRISHIGKAQHHHDESASLPVMIRHTSGGRINEACTRRKPHRHSVAMPPPFLYRSCFKIRRRGGLGLKTHRALILGMLLIPLLASAGCESIKSRFARQALPDLGPPVPLTIQMDVDPSLSAAKTEYIDGCGRIRPFSIGPTVEAVSYTHLDVYKRQIWARANHCRARY